jgi:cytochrome c oxidase assembly protein subunit 15
MLHRFSQFVVGSTVLLVLAGSLVTMLRFRPRRARLADDLRLEHVHVPPSKWVGGILYEHGHRLIASTVGFLTIILAAWIWRADSRPWMKRLGVAALLAVITQGVLGGITVLLFLPDAVSTAHAGLAEIFFCMTVAIALFTSRGWIESTDAVDDRTLRAVAAGMTALVYTQIIVGAAMRHSGAGLAIPDFPLMFGGLVPDHWNGAIAINFTHRVGALMVAAAIAATSAHIWYHHRGRRDLTRPALLLIGLVIVQITLGALTVISRRNVAINSTHVVCGALVLATSLVITLRSWRVRFAEVRLKPDATNARRTNVASGFGRTVAAREGRPA